MRFAEFVLLVENMRSAQRAYFKTRTQSNLEGAKAKERAVDQAIDGFHREFDEMVKVEQAQLPTEFQPKVHRPLVHPFDDVSMEA